jgi:hypothetical protein
MIYRRHYAAREVAYNDAAREVAYNEQLAAAGLTTSEDVVTPDEEKELRPKVRAWAKTAGVEVPARGEIPAEVVAQYKASLVPPVEDEDPPSVNPGEADPSTSEDADGATDTDQE